MRPERHGEVVQPAQMHRTGQRGASAGHPTPWLMGEPEGSRLDGGGGERLVMGEIMCMFEVDACPVPGRMRQTAKKT